MAQAAGSIGRTDDTNSSLSQLGSTTAVEDNNYVTAFMTKMAARKCRDYNLWTTFREDFEDWDTQRFQRLTTKQDLRNFLYNNGVFISKSRGRTMAIRLYDVLEQEDEEP
jgi:hypothetical protein